MPRRWVLTRSCADSTFVMRTPALRRSAGVAAATVPRVKSSALRPAELTWRARSRRRAQRDGAEPPSGREVDDDELARLVGKDDIEDEAIAAHRHRLDA